MNSPRVIQKGTLLNNITDVNHRYYVVHGLSVRVVIKMNAEWSEYFDKVYTNFEKRASSEKELLEFIDNSMLQDAHWNWIRKAYQLNDDSYEWFLLSVNESIQGACIIYHPYNSELQNGNIFYIEYVSIAPWNRKDLCETKKFSGIGPLLIDCAIKVSIEDLGLKPGFSLHSLPQANDYYINIGMQKIDHKTNNEGLFYFEMSADKAMERYNGI